MTFHYIFPQLTMGLALPILILKTMALRTGDEHYNRAARFWARILAINFARGVVTGIPMEFQFGTNWGTFLQGRWWSHGADPRHGRSILLFSRPTLAAMKGLLETENGAPLAIIGQPDLEKHRLENPLIIPRALSFLTYQRWGAMAYR